MRKVEDVTDLVEAQEHAELAIKTDGVIIPVGAGIEVCVFPLGHAWIPVIVLHPPIYSPCALVHLECDQCLDLRALVAPVISLAVFADIDVRQQMGEVLTIVAFREATCVITRISDDEVHFAIESPVYYGNTVCSLSVFRRALRESGMSREDQLAAGLTCPYPPNRDILPITTENKLTPDR